MSYTQAQISPLVINALSTTEARKTREIAERVAKSLGLASVEEAGVYSSGKAVLPSLCTNALNSLKTEGKAFKAGHGRWQAGSEQSAPAPTPSVAPAPAPSVAPAPAPTPAPEIDIMSMVKLTEQGEAWFDLSDQMTLDWIVSQQSCWGTFLKSDKACGECLLATACKASKAEVKARKAEEKAQEAERVAWSVPSDVDISQAMRLNSKGAVECVASGELIPAGGACVFISDWGVISPQVAEDLGIA